MNFTEFFNKNKNVIKATSRNKIASSIPVTEDRNNFYNGKTFKKYDLVESDGIVYRILEKCSNYYQVVDDKGNLARKFLRDLTLSEQKEFPTMVDFAIMFDASPEMIAECKAAMKTGKKDDIALLKEAKDVENYKSKDKLTVAKIIADACGVPYDVVSTPENLVNQAIRKAAKDPAIVRNKELLQNMLSIAKDVGIKYNKSIFDAKGVEESVELVEGIGIGDLVKLHKPVNGHHYGHVTGFTLSKKDGKINPMGHMSGTVEYLHLKLKKDPLATMNHSEVTKHKLSDVKKVDQYDEIQKYIARGRKNESVDEGRDDNEIASREYHGYVDAVKTGNSEKAKELKRKVDFHRHRHIKKIETIKEEASTSITYRDFMKLQLTMLPSATTADTVEIGAAAPEPLKHGHTMAPSSETNRRAKIHHHRGD